MAQETDLMRGVGSGPIKQSFPNLPTPNAGLPEQRPPVNTLTPTTGVSLTISNLTTEELNKGISQAVQDYSIAKMRGDQKGMVVAVQTATNLRALGGTEPVSFEENPATPPRMISGGANDEEAWYDKQTGSRVITRGPDAGTVVVPPARPDVAAQNIRVENAKVAYFRAQILGDAKTMNAAAKEAELARDLGATLGAAEDTPLTRSLKRYVNQVDVIKTGIRTRNTLDLNKGIVQLKNDYLYAKHTNDPVGMESAQIMGDILRKLGGTIGPEVSLADAMKMIQTKPTLPSPAPTPPVDTSPKNAEIFDRVLGFVTGAGVTTGKSLIDFVQANIDPLGTAIKAVHGFVTALPVMYQAAVDWEDTVSQIDGLLTEFRNYYESAPPFEKGRLEGEVVVQALTLIFANKQVVIRNGKLAASVHPISGVPFDVNGFPIFDAKFEAKVPAESYLAGPEKHKEIARGQLRIAIQGNLELRNSFSPEELDAIKDGKTLENYVWHHHQDSGRMQLVDEELHRLTGHTGGMALWGK